MALGPAFYSRGVFLIAFFLVGYISWRKGQRSGLRITKLTAKFFLLWGLFFLGLNVRDALLEYGVVAEQWNLALTGLPHIFAFAALGFLWKSIVVLYSADWEKYAWVIGGWGVVVAAVGIGVSLGMATGAQYGISVILGMVPTGLVLGGVGYYLARQVGGDEGIKIALLATGAWMLTILGSASHNLNWPGWSGIVINATWTLIFLGSVYWDKVKGIKW